MVSVCLRMRDPVELNDSTLQWQIKCLCKMSCQNPRNCVHPRDFYRVYREEFGPGREKQLKRILLHAR